MHTLFYVFVSVGALYATGLPLACWLGRSEDEPERMWLTAPFLGLAATVLTLESLVCLGIPLSRSTGFFWVAVLGAWSVWLFKGRGMGFLRTCPFTIGAGCALILLVHGLGLWRAGAEAYVGRAWIDEFNYTSTAQFLMERPFGTSMEQAAQQPYLIEGIARKDDRIGQSIYHGFVAASTFSDAKPIFEPVILLGPFLTFVAACLLLGDLGLPRRWRIATALASAVLPALASIHLQSFLSQALGTPLLLVWPCFIVRALDRFAPRDFIAACLVLDAATKIYAEFTVILIALGVLVCVRRPVRACVLRSLIFAGVAVVSLAMNPSYVLGLRWAYEHAVGTNALAVIFPWARQWEGLARLLVGDWAASPSVAIAAGIAMGLIGAMGIAGWGKSAWTKRDGLGLSLFALAVLPIPLGLGSHHIYQFYKILLSVAPLYVIGSALFLRSFGLGCGPVALFGLLPALASAHMTFRSGLIGATVEQAGPGGSYQLMSRPTLYAQDALSSLRGQNVHIEWNDSFFDGAYLNGWLSYFARHNRVWLENPRVSDSDITFLNFSPFNSAAVGGAFYLLRPSAKGVVAGESAALAWLTPPYAFWHVVGSDWAYITEVKSPNGLEETPEGAPFFWLGTTEAEVDFMAGSDGVATFGGRVFRGPSLPDRRERHLRVRAEQGFERDLGFPEGTGTFSIAVPARAGQNRVFMLAPDRPRPGHAFAVPSRDPRTLILQLRSLHLEAFQPPAGSDRP